MHGQDGNHADSFPMDDAGAQMYGIVCQRPMNLRMRPNEGNVGKLQKGNQLPGDGCPHLYGGVAGLRVHAAHMENGVMEIDRTLCTSCGKCIDNCVFHTVSEKKAGYAVFVGGLWGKRQRMGNRLPEIYTKEEVFQLVEKAILLYREQGWTGERFGAFIDRIGPDNFIAQLTSDEVLARKQSILDAPLLQRGESR